MLNIVVVGPGLMGKQHIQRIKENPQCTLAAIVAPFSEKNIAYSQSLGVRLYSDIDSCIHENSIDGVIIASPNKFHEEQASFCIKHSLPVLIEKPIASTVEEGLRLVELAKKYSAKVLVGHHRAHSPLLSKAKKIIDSGTIGRPVSFIGSAQFYKPSEYFLTGPWRTQVGGGPILINLIHEIGNMRTLFGEIKSVQAMASSNTRNFAVEDTVAITLSFESGALGTFMLSDTAANINSWEQTSRENPAYPYYDDENCYIIAGTKGTLYFPTFKIIHSSHSTEPSWTVPYSVEKINISRRDPLECQIEHFLDLIRGSTHPKVSAEDGYKNLLITEAISSSADKKIVVNI